MTSVPITVRGDSTARTLRKDSVKGQHRRLLSETPSLSTATISDHRNIYGKGTEYSRPMPHPSLKTGSRSGAGDRTTNDLSQVRSAEEASRIRFYTKKASHSGPVLNHSQAGPIDSSYSTAASLARVTQPNDTTTIHDTPDPDAAIRLKRDNVRSSSEEHDHPGPSQHPLTTASDKVYSITERSGTLSMSSSYSSIGWEDMQQEIELLRRAVQDMHKATRKQKKRIEELETQLATSDELLKEKEDQVVSLKERCAKSETVITAIETSIQCQICMDVPFRPFALSPCGHVLCLSCLQEWFKASGGLDEDQDEHGPNNVLFQKKTCPCCRTTVRHRPCPIFMVKDVASALMKIKKPENPAMESLHVSPVEQLDPWEGIFPFSDEESDGEFDEEIGGNGSSDGSDELDGLLLALRHRSPRFSWSSESEDEDTETYPPSSRYPDYYDTSSDEETNEPVALELPRWEPPSVQIDPDDYDLANLDQENRENVLSLLRRGCPWDMIRSFNLRYSHTRGIVVSLTSIEDLYLSDREDFWEQGTVHRIHLGWNIALDHEDLDGEVFMHSILLDIRNRSVRWRVVPENDGSVQFHRLIPASEVGEYSTTDSEAEIDSDDDTDGTDMR